LSLVFPDFKQCMMDIILRGNIGVGKSTIINFLESTGKYDIVTEPVDVWNKIGILKEFYKNKEKYAYAFQSATFVTRLANYCAPRKNKIRIFERDIEDDKICFAEPMHKQGFIDDIMWNTYLYIYDTWKNIADQMSKNNGDGPTKKIIVYLRSSPQECYNRILARKRNGEDCIPMKYLENLHNIHEKWLIKTPESSGNSSGNKNGNIIVIDVKNYEDMDKYKKYILEEFGKIIDGK
jgi:deoxyadenosine/deoxycytidine kinase